MRSAPMRIEASRTRFLTPSPAYLAGLVLFVACGDARSYAELMADAATDIEAIELERAMARYDSARAAFPDHAEAHRQYATLASYFLLNAEAAQAWEHALELEPDHSASWEGYVNDLRMAGVYDTDRRYSEKLLQILPDALRRAPDRPVIYQDAQETASRLGQLETYSAILAEILAGRPDDQILLHALESLRIALADREGGDRGQVVRDSVGATLDALAAQVEGSPHIATPALYRLAAGYDFRMLRREDDADRWLERLEAAPDRGVLADDLRYWDLTFDFQMALFGNTGEDSAEDAARFAAEGLKSRDLARQGGWMPGYYEVALRRALASIPGEAPGNATVSAAVTVAAEPPHVALEPEIAAQLFDAALDLVRWRRGWAPLQLSALRGLLYFGIEPQAVLETAAAIEEGLRSDDPGYLYPFLQGDERERSRQDGIDAARVIQARALVQLGRIEAAGNLFERAVNESRGATTLGAYGRHLLRTDRPAEALDAFVEAMAFGGSGFRGLAEEVARAADHPPGTVEARFAARRPVVEAEMERRELGPRIGRTGPEFALADQTGLEWRLSDLEGKIVVLKFWATWCGPCIEEFPHFVELQKMYEDDDEVVFLTIATAGSPRDEVARQMEENDYSFPVLLDEQDLALKYEIVGYPTTLYLDQAGIIQFKRQGFQAAGYGTGVASRIDALRNP